MGATKEYHTSSSGVPELDVQVPDGVTPEAKALAVDWLFKLTQLPSVGIVANGVAPAQSSSAGGVPEIVLVLPVAVPVAVTEGTVE